MTIGTIIARGTACYRTLRAAVFLVICAAALLLGQGCSSSPWETNYVAASGAEPLPKATPVQLREVPWDRLQAGLKQIEGEQAKSDVNAADWTPEQKAATKAKLLKTLQVNDDPATVAIIGRSDFRTTTPLRPEAGDQTDLIDFARKVGATKVVWSRRLVGQADTIIQEPVTTYSTDHHGHGGGVFSESSTTWVPLSVRADQYAFVAYYLKEETRP